MPAAFTPWLRRAGSRARRRLGLGGLVGVALMLAALALLPLTLHLDRSARVQGLEVQRVLARLGKPAETHALAALPADDLALLDALPPFSQNAADLQAIFDAARQAGVTLGQGDYTLRAEPGAPMLQFSASFPVHEGYAALKSFVAFVLANVPHAALEEMKVSRPDAGGTVLDATVRLSLAYRKP